MPQPALLPLESLAAKAAGLALDGSREPVESKYVSEILRTERVTLKTAKQLVQKWPGQ